MSGGGTYQRESPRMGLEISSAVSCVRNSTLVYTVLIVDTLCSSFPNRIP